METNAMVTLGKVVGAHGIRGLVKIAFYSGQVPDLGNDPLIELKRGNTETLTAQVLNISPHQHQFIVQLAGVDDRNAAEALVGAEILMPRSRLPEPEADSYYWTDLIGMAVTTIDGQSLGTLAQILETGANDVYVVRQGRRERLIPALARVVRRIDLEKRQMWVDLPEGL